MLNKDIVWWLVVGSCGLLVLAYFFSYNTELWFATFGALLVSVWLLGGKRTQPVLLWMIGISWLEVSADLLAADLSGSQLSDMPLSMFRVQAAIGMLCALMVLALGMRVGLRLVRRRASAKPLPADPGINLSRAVMAFFASLILIDMLYLVAGFVPVIRQPVIAFAALKFACIYLVASIVFQKGRGYPSLLLVLFTETALGLTGFFGTYKEAFFIVLIALATSGRRLPPRIWSFGVPTVALVVWLSLFWTAVKPEYRAWVSGNTGTQTVARPLEDRIIWIGDKFLFDQIDYPNAAISLLRRVAYVYPYAAVLSYASENYVSNLQTFRMAVEHVLMPRLFFPGKAALNDSATTTALTGWQFVDNTSVSVGYIAEAHHDFGVPWMFLPIMGIGMMLGAAARYFLTRKAPTVITQAFAVSLLFSAFPLGMDIDKALGGFLTQFIALSLTLKFGYPKLARWLAGRPRRAASFQRRVRDSVYGLRPSEDPARMDVR